MTRHERSPRPRCLAVWLMSTGSLAALLPWLLAVVARPTDVETALVSLMALGGTGACCWLWLLITVTTSDAARGQAARVRGGVPPGVRRAVLAACGVALASTGLALPAHADGEHPHRSPLSGLPLPDRPTTLSSLGPAFQVARVTGHPTHHRTQAHPTPRPGAVVVRPGDTLWAIAQRHLSSPASDAAVDRACRRLYELNRAVIGDDPDLIRPGQRLHLPDLTQEDS